MANEKWLIDAWDLIEWLDDFDRENNLRILTGKKAKLHSSHAIKNKIFTVPRVDAVEVVRCEFCEHWDKGYRFCKLHGLDYYGNSSFGENGFCSYGERRTDGN